jgi:predicted short-subunit dehydrogenase-like oxidoreductase (DUF2520 family)
MTEFNVSFAGAGRVAGALCRAMFQSGINILQIVSQSELRGQKLAGSCNARWSSVLSFDKSNDIIIVSVPDHNLKEVLSKIKCAERTIVAHTAGSYGLDIFPGIIKRHGVFYPLQTFSIERHIDFRNLPFLLEASEPEAYEILKNLARKVGSNVYSVDAEHRKMLHLSAVFVCNFTNYMLTAGKEVAARAGMSFEILVPLIRETISKALENGPERSQTGPAIRNDSNTIEKHLELLSFSPELQKIYREMTKSIMGFYNIGNNGKF